MVTGKISDIGIDYMSNKPKITFIFDNKCVLENAETLKDTKLNIEFKKWFKKRSKNANSYAWVLITELANVMRISKDEMYLLKLKDYGQSELVLIDSIVNPAGYFKYYDEVGETEVNGKKFKWYKVYKGSSEYDSREMSIFIDGIVRDCKEQGIETLTPNELKRLKEDWGKMIK